MAYGAEQIGIFKLARCECVVEKFYLFNDAFHVPLNSPFWDDAEQAVRFTEDKTLDLGYRTKFGPSFSHRGIIYAISAHNLNYAARRLTGIPAENIEQYYNMRDNQLRNYTSDLVLENYYSEMFAYINCKHRELIDELLELIEKPHEKKELRIAAFEYLSDEGRLESDTFMMDTTGKVKGDEYAKPGKYPRLVNDLTTPASLLGAVFTKMMKDYMAAHPVPIAGGAHFVASPSPAGLETAFNILYKPNDDYSFIYFSDDSCVQIHGVVYNMDIASCDASHGPATFDAWLTRSTGRAHNLMSRLLQQLKTDLKLRTRGGAQKIRLKPRRHLLYSGTTLTTAHNGSANCAIFARIVHNRAVTVEEIVQAAFEVGYRVTLTRCDDMSDCQFLKHSPYVLDGRIIPVLNTGVVLRALGTCRGDLPRGDIREQARLFNSGLSKGFNSGYVTSIQQMLVVKFGSDGIIDKTYLPYGYTVGSVLGQVSDEFIIRRYRLTAIELDELKDLLWTADFGDVIGCSASHKILELDYGLGYLF